MGKLIFTKRLFLANYMGSSSIELRVIIIHHMQKIISNCYKLLWESSSSMMNWLMGDWRERVLLVEGN
jgi:hypothetical protein